MSAFICGVFFLLLILVAVSAQQKDRSFSCGISATTHEGRPSSYCAAAQIQQQINTLSPAASPLPLQALCVLRADSENETGAIGTAGKVSFGLTGLLKNCFSIAFECLVPLSLNRLPPNFLFWQSLFSSTSTVAIQYKCESFSLVASTSLDAHAILKYTKKVSDLLSIGFASQFWVGASSDEQFYSPQFGLFLNFNV